MRTMVLVVASFAGGALFAHASHAESEQRSPYAPLSQMARVLVLMENQYVDPVERERILDGAIKGMVRELDPHSAYMDPREFALFNQDTEGSFGGIGVEVDFRDELVVVIAPIPETPAARAGVLPGDFIIAVDGKLLRGMSIEKIVRLMRGPPNTKVRITVKRKGVDEPLNMDLVREHIHVRSVESKAMAERVGYLRLKQFQHGTHEELLEEIAKLRKGSVPLSGILLDMRNNPGGLVDEAEAVADELLDGGAIYSTRHRGRILEEVHAHRGGALTRLPVVVLVNEYSASSAELVAGALRGNKRALIVGARTFGKGSVQTIFQLPGGAGLRLTTMRYYTPEGHAIQAAGIQPEVLVQHQTEDGGDDIVWREDQLEGHLAPELAGSRRKPARVIKGGKRPQYRPLKDIPADPRKGDDRALEAAFEELVARLRKG
jgi:carboxyl-terminal processing protease